MKEEILLLKIHNGLKDGKNYYEATRGNWKINKKRLETIQYAVGINRGKIVCAFEPSEWMTIEEGADVGRKRFIGKEAPSDILKTFQENEKFLVEKFGNAQSLAYSYLDDIKVLTE
ncbi:hypothetical protein [Rossellomorea marisflavi]|uniref:hypothetical protein n=1 Tax=Rossellomorea marisflavi TaxID=189381 RepID=UPI00345A7483